ncbi:MULTISPECIES: peptide-methionine (S)-S-oxide reductase MsrA [unclassified Rhizobium]|uniref:peptide-methionine (S)-S-oxide reductase MsrA n=1 Tax=unclassified Rhizobium TaxID=2613769 RepID=UPI00104E55B5|nr:MULTISPECIES: peptide-methionine (S)-S-oxide reductase MsrA [unclassified Rhizobium]MBB3398061.1 peptide-methionine (S)-S-oxide reductase [Rhizobium sp. BK060]MBB4171058.1 peptide-methionine (S)-S-oxide reductase [Rhizobium sp. BK538]TCM70037.1 peptide-methionine (S)-S-oxide reductase [Rhizobium sp. BK068]
MKTREKTRLSPLGRIARLGLVALAVIGGGGLALKLTGGSAPEEARPVPPALHDVAATSGMQSLVLAGGCFWGVQGAFQHVAGVVSATAGYAGGSAATATYEITETGQTDHAEAVEIVFNPKQITYGQLLQIFFSVVHDPTQVDQQGPDVGKQYRSAIFPLSDEQAKVASDYVAQLGKEGAFGRPIATSIEIGKTFYRAEAYHQDYVYNNPSQPYVYIYEQPKIEALKRLFPVQYRERPVLVAEQAG